MSFKKTPTEQAPKYLGMAWYKFLTSYGLITGAVFNFLYSFAFLSGSMYSSETNGEVSAEQIYSYYGETLRVVDMAYGLFLIGIAVLAIFLRSKLANFEPDTMRYVYVFYGSCIAAPVVYLLTVVLITGQVITLTPANVSVLASLVFSFFHIRYFRKRAYLFVGKTETSDDLVQELPPTSDSPYPSSKIEDTFGINTDDIFFCRNCGVKLMADSTFCHKCGKKIR